MSRTPAPPIAWKNRIIEIRNEDPQSLLANPWNFRIHSKKQQEAMSGALDELGWLEPVMVNINTQHLINGHMRVSLALSREEAEIPVLYVDLTAEEEKIALATIDPIGSLAAMDREKFDELTQDVYARQADLARFIEGLRSSGPAMLANLTGDRGQTPEERLEVYKANNIHQVVLLFARNDYDEIVSKLEQAREKLGVETNTEAAGAIIRDWYENNISRTGSAGF